MTISVTPFLTVTTGSGDGVRGGGGGDPSGSLTAEGGGGASVGLMGAKVQVPRRCKCWRNCGGGLKTKPWRTEDFDAELGALPPLDIRALALFGFHLDNEDIMVGGG